MIILLNLFLHGLKKNAVWVGVLICLWQICFVLFGKDWQYEGVSKFFTRNFHFNFFIDGLSLVMLLSIGIVVFTALMIGRSTIKDDEKLFNFTNLVILVLIGMNGVVFAMDIFSLYVFLEVTAVSSFILIALNKNINSLEGSFKYLVLSAVATVLMLTSIALLFITSGDTSLIAIKYSINPETLTPLQALAICIFIGAFFIKGGLFPFHGWLPDAYSSAPAPVSVLLAGVVTKTTGIYVLIRLFAWVFGFNDAIRNIFMIVGAVSIVFGALAAITQKDFKRMLAYSSISQVGYIVLALGTGTLLGMAGAIFHFFNHAIFKSQLFANGAAVEAQTGTTDMDKLGGLTKKMPVTGFTSVVACLSTAGLPPFAGFWSKLVIILALWKSDNIMYAAIAVIASLITLAYFLSMQRRVFFGKLAEGFENLKEAEFGMILPVVVLALITIGIGVFFPFIINTIILPISKIL